MNKYIQYINEFQESNVKWINFINNTLSIYLKDWNKENQTDIEHILDYIYSNQDKEFNFNYTHLLNKANKWTKKLIESTVKTNDEEEWATEIIKEFENGFKIVKLVSEESYKREWALMSHCVGSYYWRDVEIYSLRDENNFPHCTIENWNQIKGKGNWKIIPKYIKYVVEFLEYTGMNIRESEMNNLWYINVDFFKKQGFIKEWITLFRDRYYYGEDLVEITKEWIELIICDNFEEYEYILY